MKVQLNVKRRGFTLIEFFVVVVVLAVLIALLPALFKAKARSSRIACRFR